VLTGDTFDIEGGVGAIGAQLKLVPGAADSDGAAENSGTAVNRIGRTRLTRREAKDTKASSDCAMRFVMKAR
jgi:hypothetical protein